MYPYGTFTFEKTNCVGHTKFWRYTQAEVNMIIPSMTFKQVQSLLTTQISDDSPYFPSQFPIYGLMPVFCYKYYMIFADPLYM